jgi:hypothetical protein
MRYFARAPEGERERYGIAMSRHPVHYDGYRSEGEWTACST